MSPRTAGSARFAAPQAPSASQIRIRRPFRGAIVIATRRSTRVAASRSTRKRCSIIASAILISIVANAAPMHMRGPALKGLYS